MKAGAITPIHGMERDVKTFLTLRSLRTCGGKRKVTSVNWASQRIGDRDGEQRNQEDRNIAFRVTADEYAQIERIALAMGEDPNVWCRNIIVSEARQGSGLTKTERLLYEEIARARYLVGHGFRLLFAPKETAAEAWKKITADIDQYSEIIADDLLSRRK